jgi:transcription antitermination protein NusB
MGARHSAREYALHALYMYDTVSTPMDILLSLSWVDDEVPEDVEKFFEKIVKGTIEHISEIDTLIKKHCKNWSLERIAAVDRAILRISVYSMIYLDDVDPVISINEGIELGKKFGGDGSGHFINGILDAVHRSDVKH